MTAAGCADGGAGAGDGAARHLHRPAHHRHDALHRRGQAQPRQLALRLVARQGRTTDAEEWLEIIDAPLKLFWFFHINNFQLARCGPICSILSLCTNNAFNL